MGITFRGFPTPYFDINPMPADIATLTEVPEAGKLCGAKTRSGGTCKQRPMKGSKRCRMHGGKTPRGTASPHYKHGRYSRHMPEALNRHFREAERDDTLLSCRAEVALLSARMVELLENLKTGESGSLWEQLREAAGLITSGYDAMRSALNRGDDTALTREMHALAGPLHALRGVVTKALGVEGVWEEIKDLVERKTRTAKREWERLEALQAVVTAEQAMSLINAIMASVVRNCPDAKARQQIAYDISLFIRHTKGEPAPSPAPEQPAPANATLPPA